MSALNIMQFDIFPAVGFPSICHFRAFNWQEIALASNGLADYAVTCQSTPSQNDAFHLAQPCICHLQYGTVCAPTCKGVKMGHFLVVPGVVAVCGERLVAIIDVAPERIVVSAD
jgi:hypothetical protein